MKTTIFALTLLIGMMVGGGVFAAVEHVETGPYPGGIGDEPSRRLQMSNVRQTWGEVVFVDVQTGRLSLKQTKPGASPETKDFVISSQETAVTDPKDRQFLKLEDLKVGQQVAVEYAEADGRVLAKSITVHAPEGRFIALGEVDAIDLRNRILVLRESKPQWEATEKIYFLAQREEINEAEKLRPGDPVQLEYSIQDGRRVVEEIR